MSRARSRYHRTIGADTFSSGPAPSCPAGQHYVPDDMVIRGLVTMGKCVPNVVAVSPLVLRRLPAPAAAPAPVVVQPLTFHGPAATMPSGGDFAPAPAPSAPATVCPDLWPWWWILVAAGAGVGLGYYVQKNQKKTRRNVGRIVNGSVVRVINGAADAAMSRLLG